MISERRQRLISLLQESDDITYFVIRSITYFIDSNRWNDELQQYHGYNITAINCGLTKKQLRKVKEVLQ